MRSSSRHLITRAVASAMAMKMGKHVCCEKPLTLTGPNSLRCSAQATGGHPWHEEVGVKIEEPNHPLVGAFEGKNFRLKEEIFQFREPYSRKKVRVLLSLDTKTTNMNVPWIHRKDNDFALAWARLYGKGRVFYCVFGHRTEIWWNPTILRFYLDGIQFAIGDLDAPAEPR